MDHDPWLTGLKRKAILEQPTEYRGLFVARALWNGLRLQFFPPESAYDLVLGSLLDGYYHSCCLVSWCVVGLVLLG